MKNQSIALDLKVSRRKTGLLQADVAHLLGIDEKRVCNLEHGRQLPTVGEAMALSLVFSKPLEVLLAGLIDETVENLAARLRTLPNSVDDNEEPGFNRTHTLAELARRLNGVTRENV